MTVEENIRRLLRSPTADIRGEYTPVPPVYQPQPYEVRPADVAGIPQSTVAAAEGMSRPAAPQSPAGVAPPAPAADELTLPDPAAPTRADYREQRFGERDSVEDDPMGVSARQRQQMAQAQGKPVREFEQPKGPYADLREKNEAKKRAQETAARTAIAMQGLGVLTEQRAKRHSQQGFAGQFVTPAEQLEYLYNQHRTNVPGFAEEYPSFEAYVAGAFGGGSAEDVANKIDQHLSAIEQGPKFPGRTGQGGQGVQEQPRMPMGRRERSTTGVPPEGTDPKEWDGETRGKRGRDLFNPDAQTTPTGGTFTVNPNGSMSMRGVNPESYKVYDDYRRNFGENDERTVMAGAAAVGLDPQKYGDDMVSLAADVQRRMKEVERYQGRFERRFEARDDDEGNPAMEPRVWAGPAGKPVMSQQIGPDGNPVFDADGNPVMAKAGEVVIGEDGNPEMVPVYWDETKRTRGSTYRTQVDRIGPDGKPVMRQQIGPDGKPVLDAEGNPVMVPVKRTVTRNDGKPMWKPEEQVDGSTRLVQTEEGKQYNDDQRANVLADQTWQRWGAQMQANGMTRDQLNQIALEEGPAGIAKINKAYWADRMANSRAQLAAQNAQRAMTMRINQGYGPAIVANTISTAQSPQELAAALWLGNMMNQGVRQRREVAGPNFRMESEQEPTGTSGMDLMGGLIGNMQGTPDNAADPQAALIRIQSLPPDQRPAALLRHYQSQGMTPAEAKKAADDMEAAMRQGDTRPANSWLPWNWSNPFGGAPTGGVPPANVNPWMTGGVPVSAAPARRPRPLSNLV